MYWIASYPRSGNTFLRILFKEVYGIDTWEGYGKAPPKEVFEYYNSKTDSENIFIKTHELPSKTEIPHQKLKSIYLVRDGRDASVSMAYHRLQLVKPGSNFLFNLRTIILTPNKIPFLSWTKPFGGWSRNVEQWSAVADIVIKFEDLISNPKAELKRIEKVISLPPANYEKIPTFEDLKSKNFDYGSGNDNQSKKQRMVLRKKFFRSGKTGNWRQDIPKPLQEIFNRKNSKMLELYGYENNIKPRFNLVNSIYQYILWCFGFIKDRFNN